MKIFRDLEDFTLWRQTLTGNVGFVPTMGALHEGHLSLLRRSQTECDHTIVSIFVNPTQFNQKDDLNRYPRDEAKDMSALESLSIDAVLLPTEEALYPKGYNYFVGEKNLSSVLCGPRRPGHFEGVLTVVMKLLNITKCQKAYFGEKDYQQLKLIQAMVTDFFMPVEILSAPTVREADGLAMSSRNTLLSPEARKIAPRLHENLHSNISLENALHNLKAAGFQVEYLEEHWGRRFAAVNIDGVRLIDNV